MESSDFLSVFEICKERFLQQGRHTVESKRALETFEKWLKLNPDLLSARARGEKNLRIDMGRFFANVILEAENILAGKGVQIKCISLGLKESSKCITAFTGTNIYYRLGKTCPRKGKYKGKDLVVMELVMDGNKNNIFLPLLKNLRELERRLGAGIERESARVEATGKYRFKLYFPFVNDDSADAVRSFAVKLADFIYMTREELVKLIA